MLLNSVYGPNYVRVRVCSIICDFRSDRARNLTFARSLYFAVDFGNFDAGIIVIVVVFFPIYTYIDAGGFFLKW